MIHAAPASSMPGAATHTFGASATTSIAPTCSSEPSRTMRSKLVRSRRRVIWLAATIAPAPMHASSSVKLPAPPPSRSCATSGSSASSAVDWAKNSATRSSTTCMRRLCRTCCTPTRIAPMKRSAGSALACTSRFQRQIATAAPVDSSALSTNTHCVPAPAMIAPATTGPTMRDAFIAMPLSASAGASCGRGRISGTRAANTGQRIARPTPLAKVSASSSSGVISPASSTKHASVATTATHSCVTMR